MGNCLITKLKSVVNNSSLSKLGVLRVSGFSYEEKHAKFYVNYKNDGVDRSSLRAQILDDSFNLLQEVAPIHVYYGWAFEFFKDAIPQNAVYIDIPEKYDLSGIGQEESEGSAFVTAINIKDLDFTRLFSINSFSQMFAPMTLDELAVQTDLSTLLYWDNRVTGDIASLAPLKMAAVCEIASINIRGTLESLLEAWFNGYTEDRNIRGFFKSSFITFNGVPFANDHVEGKSWYAAITQSGITVGSSQGASDLGTYDGSTWSYA